MGLKLKDIDHLKLKMTEDDEESGDVVKKMKCKVCNKEFRSGKALGGHMRVHVQQRQHQTSTAAMIKKKQKFDIGINESDPKCFVCEKSFVSLKSLFGHMRCHPDREWRGMQPPSSSSSSTFLYSDHDQINESYSAALSAGWSKKAKRGFRKNAIVMNSSTSNTTKPADDDQHESKIEEDESYNRSNQHRIVLVSEELTMKPEFLFERLISCKFSQTEEHSAPVSLMKNNNIIGKKRKRVKTVKLKDLDQASINHVHSTAPTAAKYYKCMTCDKPFASPQALGGHRSSAHKERMIRNNNFSQELLLTAPRHQSGLAAPTKKSVILDFDLNQLPADDYQLNQETCTLVLS